MHEQENHDRMQREELHEEDDVTLDLGEERNKEKELNLDMEQELNEEGDVDGHQDPSLSHAAQDLHKEPLDHDPHRPPTLDILPLQSKPLNIAHSPTHTAGHNTTLH